NNTEYAYQSAVTCNPVTHFLPESHLRYLRFALGFVGGILQGGTYTTKRHQQYSQNHNYSEDQIQRINASCGFSCFSTFLLFCRPTAYNCFWRRCSEEFQD